MNRIKKIPDLIETITILGLIVYVAQSWYFANSVYSIGDEGSYLYKGYMFAKGVYHPFQEYGFWTNKSPLAFLIPGYIQLWFGPGLAVARYFAILVSLLMLTGVWITAHRLGGKGWAALVVWAFALADTQISTYSQALSQGLVACMMAWLFVFALGEERALWQLIVGAALSSLIVMTRQNMAIVPVLFVIYVYWQHGKKAGGWALVTSSFVLIGFHILYWPGIFQLWTPWLPRSLTPFLDYFRNSSTLSPGGLGDVSMISRVQSFVTGIRDHFFIMFGAVSALILWPAKKSWKSIGQFKMAVALGVMYFTLFFMHFLASLLTSYCVYCYSAYQMFYNTAGFFFILVVLLNSKGDTKIQRSLLIVSSIFFMGCLGLYYYRRWYEWLLNNVHLLRINKIFSAGKFSTVSLGDMLTYALALPLETQKRLAPHGGRFVDRYRINDPGMGASALLRTKKHGGALLADKHHPGLFFVDRNRCPRPSKKRRNRIWMFNKFSIVL